MLSSFKISGLQFLFICICRINFHNINKIELKIATRGLKLRFLTNLIFSEAGACSDSRSMPHPHTALIRYFVLHFLPNLPHSLLANQKKSEIHSLSRFYLSFIISE